MQGAPVSRATLNDGTEVDFYRRTPIHYTSRLKKTMPIDKSADIGGMRLHYLERAGEAGPIVFLHGLSANAHCFDYITETALSTRFRVLALDLRGRGASDKPLTGYSIEEHAADVIAWLDALQIDNVILAGHSYGGFLASFLAVHYSARVSRLVLLDIADSAVRSPRVAALLRPSLARLTLSWPSRGEYLEAMRATPFLTAAWDSALERYYGSDVIEGDDGLVRTCARVECVADAAQHAARLDWTEVLRQIRQPTLLFHATDRFGDEGTTPLILHEEALATARLMCDCRSVAVPGNHITMLFGDGAKQIANGLTEFLSSTP
jgi:pimeloyl-ACP methyl ester carboxylesterase